MIESFAKSIPNRPPNEEKILLLLLPFWTPLIPPMGISSLKSFLGGHGYPVKTVDVNVEPELGEMGYQYFNSLKEFIPRSRWGNFYNLGHNVLRNHLMAHLNQQDEAAYRELVQILAARFFYHELSPEQVTRLNEIVAEFYGRLKRYLLALYAQEQPTVLGISVFGGTLAPSVFAFKLMKELDPGVRTIMGGGVFADQMTLGSPNLEYFLEKTPWIDQVIIGEGQKLFLKWLKGELLDAKRVVTLKDIQDETMAFEGGALPDYEDLNLGYYPYLGATGSKSCPNQCSFCNVARFWGRHLVKEPRQTAAEMTALYHKYGFQLFFMTDSLLNPIASELAQEFINSGLIIYWDGYYRVDEAGCNPENTLLWRRGGFYRARMGVESGSQHVLDMMGKMITPQKIRKVVSTFANAGIKTTTYWVIGHPGETESDFQQTLDLLTELKDDIWEAECNPFYYFYNGQASSEEWARKRILVYPESARDMLISQTWDVDCEPSREEVYRRVFRFTELCDRLGIPNPYTLTEVHTADERWKKLHHNAVPSLIDFQGKGHYVDEHLAVKKLIRAGTPALDDQNFEFF